MTAPDWSKVYRDCGHDGARDQEPITVTRETARLALAALDRANGQCAYHNSMTAAGELRGRLDGDRWPI